MYTRPLQKAFVLVCCILTIVVCIVHVSAQNMKSGFHHINITSNNFLYIYENYNFEGEKSAPYMGGQFIKRFK